WNTSAQRAVSGLASGAASAAVHGNLSQSWGQIASNVVGSTIGDSVVSRLIDADLQNPEYLKKLAQLNENAFREQANVPADQPNRPDISLGRVAGMELTASEKARLATTSVYTFNYVDANEIRRNDGYTSLTTATYTFSTPVDPVIRMEDLPLPQLAGAGSGAPQELSWGQRISGWVTSAQDYLVERGAAASAENSTWGDIKHVAYGVGYAAISPVDTSGLQDAAVRFGAAGDRRGGFLGDVQYALGAAAYIAVSPVDVDAANAQLASWKEPVKQWFVDAGAYGDSRHDMLGDAIHAAAGIGYVADEIFQPGNLLEAGLIVAGPAIGKVGGIAVNLVQKIPLLGPVLKTDLVAVTGRGINAVRTLITGSEREGIAQIGRNTSIVADATESAGKLNSYGFTSAKYQVSVAADGRRVYKNVLDINPEAPALVDSSVNKSIRQKIKDGWTNLDLMNNGYAPIGPDGKQINLHHILGQESGPMVELQATTHQTFSKQLHGLIENGRSFRNDPILTKQYNDFRREWWTARAGDFNGE
ncbi:hypothetical protein KCV01_g17297, partial [Aureobasidium melanogenum]